MQALGLGSAVQNTNANEAVENTVNLYNLTLSLAITYCHSLGFVESTDGGWHNL
jgi:hypothetical protein